MPRLILTLAALALLAGCQRTPRIDPFATFGETRVPSPSTSSYGSVNNYYQRPNASDSPQSNNQAAPQPGTFVEHPQSISVVPSWQQQKNNAPKVHLAQSIADSFQNSNARQVQHQSDAQEAPLRIIESSRPSQHELSLKGMHVNDVTTGTPTPARFNPDASAIPISQLPPAVNTGFTNSSAQPIGSGTNNATQPIGGGTKRAALQWRSAYKNP